MPPLTSPVKQFIRQQSSIKVVAHNTQYSTLGLAMWPLTLYGCICLISPGVAKRTILPCRGSIVASSNRGGQDSSARSLDCISRRRCCTRRASTIIQGFNFSPSPLRCCVPCVGTMLRASTMASAPARAARDSSRGQCRRTPSTSAWLTRTARWTSGEETVASSVGSRSV